jgi:AmpE protein
MIFLATLITLLIERFFHWTHLRRWNWFTRYQNWVAAKLGNRHPALLLAIDVLPIALILGLMSYALCGWAYGIGHLILGTVVLLYCLGPNNLWDQTYQCLGQFIFWFALLGPMGAFLYRAIELSGASPATSSLAIKLQNILDWIPARILTFFFALTGHFSKVFTRWLSVIRKGFNQNDVVLTECGMAALDSANQPALPEDGSAEKEALMLFDRALILTLVILAVITLVRL